MVGIPKTLATRQDWLHIFDYVQSKNDEELNNEFRLRLAALYDTRCMKVLKDGIDKAPEDRTSEDFDEIPDPASPLALSGLTEGEINQMIGALE